MVDMFQKGALRPFAHRGLHDAALPENSLGAFAAAIAGGYGIELDVQPSSEGTPMVFHDTSLARMTGHQGVISQLSQNSLKTLTLGASRESIPTLVEALDLIAGRAPLLIELKDQSGTNTGDRSGLAQNTCALLADYDGPVAVMSFNPDLVAAAKRAPGGVPVGLISCAYEEKDWPHLSAERRASLARLDGFHDIGAHFISHDWRDLRNPAVQALKRQGIAVICWTIRTAGEARTALANGADAITFEGFRP